jgi:hypothetical protein
MRYRKKGARRASQRQMFRSSLRSFFETLAEAAPPGYTAAHKYPADDVSLLHEQVGFRWKWRV